MIALYPFIHSPCEDLELLLSVRSLKRLSTVPTKVVIVGDRPKCWADLGKLEFELVHIPHTRAEKVSPVQDVQAKLLLGARQNQGDILFLHDDMLVLQDQAEINHEYRGILVPGTTYWGVVTKYTMGLLGLNNPKLNFECHTPVVMNTDLLAQVFAGGATTLPKDILLKSLYLNWPGVKDYHARQGIKVVPGKNRKMMAVDSFDQPTLDRYRQSTAFISIHHKVTIEQLKSAVAEGWV